MSDKKTKKETGICLEKDILVLDTLKCTLTPPDFLNQFCTHIICESGKGQFKIAGESYQMERNDIVIWPPETNVTDIMLSTDFNAQILLLSRNFLCEIRPNKLSVEGFLYLLKNPVFRLTDEERELCVNNCKQLGDRVASSNNIFYKAIMTSLAQIFIYDIWNIYSNELNKRTLSDQGVGLFERFLLLVQDNCFTNREVSFYADKLHVTPKYLSVVCKKSSGQTASDWIDEYAIQDIRVLLKNEKLSIKDIANQMNFCNQSFFGRYVKRLLGVSPLEYRRHSQNTQKES